MPGRVRGNRPHVGRWLAGGAAGAVVGAGGLAYWLLMSPFSQWWGPFPYRGRPGAAGSGEKLVALTFDDGPNEPYTSQIADALAARAVRATFFQVGVCVHRHPEVTARLARDGHVIGNHSYVHRFTRCFGARSLRTEVGLTQQVLFEQLGRWPLLYRPPWLLRSRPLRKILTEHSLHPVSGEFGHALEVFQPSPERLARRAVAKVRPGSIVIFHDGFDGRGGNRASTAAAVAHVVDQLQAKGYRFVTIDELLDVPAYRETQPGR